MFQITEKMYLRTPVSEGDAGIILRANGEFHIFSSGVVPGTTELNEAQMAQAEKLIALALALSIPSVMDALIALSKDEAVLSKDIVKTTFQ